MKQEEISDSIAAGRKKAEQRRGVSSKLGIRRVRMVTRTTTEEVEVEVSAPKTEEEIRASIDAGHQTARQRQKDHLAARLVSRTQAAEIKERGFRLDYDVIPGRMVSIAYNRNQETGDTDVYFAIKSFKDCFSRSGARKSLLEHMDAGTHHLSINIEKETREDMLVDLHLAMTARMNTNPEEFPSKVISRWKEVEETQNAFFKMTSAMDKLLALGKKNCDCQDCRDKRESTIH